MSERVKVEAKKPEVKHGILNSKMQRSEKSRSMDTPVDRILYLQRTAGNQAVSRLMKSGALQAKLRIGQPGDMYEQEADRVADAVMRMPELGVQRQVDPEEEEEEEETLQSKPLANQITPLVQVQRQEELEEEEMLQAKPVAGQITPLVQRQVEPEEEEEELQAKATSGHLSEVNSNLESHIQSLKGGGQPLPKSVRAYMEPRFGRNFSRVRVHTDTRAVESARAVNARAFTVGQDVVFGAGQYALDTNTGQKLMAHELTHVVQQSITKPVEADANAAKFSKSRRGTEDSGQWFSGTGLRLNRLIIQRPIVFGRPVTDDATSKEAKNEIGEAKRLLSDHSLDPTLRKELQNRIKKAEATLKAYGQTIDSSSAGMHPMFAMITKTGNPAAVVVMLALMVGWLLASKNSRSEANRRAAEELANALQTLGAWIKTIVLMTAVGNVVHGHIVDEARRLAVALGLANTVGAVTKEMLCKMLERMAKQNRRTDTDKWKKIVSTEKGLSCRRYRASK